MSNCDRILRSRGVVPFEPGFLSGNSRVLTPSGLTGIETLKEGEMVITYNQGAVPVVGIKTTNSSCRGLMEPVALEFHENENLLISPSSLLMIKSSYSDIYFGSSLALVQASSLKGSELVCNIDPQERIFFSLILDHADIVSVEGFLVECRGLDEGADFGSDSSFGKMINRLGQYPVLDDDEARLLFEMAGGVRGALLMA